jgi:hypothetical protein
MLVFSHTVENERFWACFRENWVYKFGHWCDFFPAIYFSIELSVQGHFLRLCF